MKRYWKIAVLANIKDDAHPKPEGVPPDAFADFDHIETIDSIRAALETDGHQTIFIHADTDLPYALRDEKPDICFNIAEGLGGDARGTSPCIIGNDADPLYRFPCIGQRISLDKTLTKRSGGIVVSPLPPSRSLARVMNLCARINSHFSLSLHAKGLAWAWI